jgi:hypothetical protein
MRTLLVGLAGSVSLGLLVAASPVLAAPDTSVAAMSGTNASSDVAKDVAQVSSVSELTDIDPNSWAFQSLKSLVERYGCIEGYPSKKYLGNRPLSRYEFAAGLNACLDKIGEQIAAATEPLVTKEDLAPLQRLQERFKEELSIMRGEIDGLEAKTKELEAKQFSTTTKLDGETIFALAGASAGGNVNTNNAVGGPSIGGSSQNVIFGGRTRLNLRAKNLGVEGDELRVRLTAATDGGSFFGTGAAPNDVRVGRLDYLGSGAGGGTNVTNGNSRVSFDKVYYEFPLFSKDFKVRIGPRNENKDTLGLQPNTRDDQTQFSLRGFHRNIGLALVGAPVPSVSAIWKLSDQWSLRSIYSALAGGDSNGFGSGGVTGPSQAAIELGYKPEKTLDIGIGYYRTVCNATSALNAEAPSSQNQIFCAADSGGSTFYPFQGALGGAGGPPRIGNVQHDTFNIHADWEFSPDISLFGRYSFGNASISDGIAPGVVGGNLNYSEWLAGLAFNNTFGRKGDSLGIAVLQPANITSNSAVAGTFPPGTFPGASSVPTATELDYGFYYRYTLTKNFTVGPEVYIITNPGSIAGNPTVTQAIFRALYKF